MVVGGFRSFHVLVTTFIKIDLCVLFFVDLC